MPGGYINGSGTMYFVGDLTADGYFVAEGDDYPRWLDYGADCYAGVTWSNAPEDRKVMVAWMNNWDYAPACPPSLWKSAFTLPREYSLRDVEGKLVLCSQPVKELESLAGDWIDLPADSLPLPLTWERGMEKGLFSYDLPADSLPLPLTGERGRGKGLFSYELRATVSLTEDAEICLSNAYGERYVVRVDSRCRRILSDRSRAGLSNFSPLFAVPSMSAPIEGSADRVELRLVVDQSSVELFADEGATCVTNTVYPRAIYSVLDAKGALEDVRFRPLHTVWE